MSSQSRLRTVKISLVTCLNSTEKFNLARFFIHTFQREIWTSTCFSCLEKPFNRIFCHPCVTWMESTTFTDCCEICYNMVAYGHSECVQRKLLMCVCAFLLLSRGHFITKVLNVKAMTFPQAMRRLALCLQSEFHLWNQMVSFCTHLEVGIHRAKFFKNP